MKILDFEPQELDRARPIAVGLSMRASAESDRPPVELYVLMEDRILREALARMFRRRSEFRVVGHSGYSDAALALILRVQCHVVLSSRLTMASSPPEVITQIVAASPRTEIVLLDMEQDESSFLRAVQWGIAGYVLREASMADVLVAVRGVARGEAVCPPKLCRALFRLMAQEARVTPMIVNQRMGRKLGLTSRQQQLMSLVAQGKTNKEIAKELNLSEFTVKNHMYRIMKQVGANSRFEAIENIRANGFSFAMQVL